MSSATGTPPEFTTQTVASELRILAGKLIRRLREESSQGDLSLSQLMALGRLSRDGAATVTSLAKLEGVRSQSMGATVASLEEAGLVRGDPDPSDGRQTIISLTDKGQSVVRANRAAREDWLVRSLQTKLSSAEQRQLSTALVLIRQLLEDPK
jgi:DNA-binding MarR family transcriptional regulator